MEVRRVLPYDENDQPVITYQPPASATVAGVVKIGNNLTMSEDGVLSANSQGITVDSALSLTSENPVQNKVITSALGSKADTSAIPTATSDLTNDSGFITTSALTNYALKSELPEDVSELNNDAGYITSSAVGDATITITQDGITKGSFTVNQTTDATISLDGGSTPSWGSIEGTLSNQGDLQAALDAKENKITAVEPLTLKETIKSNLVGIDYASGGSSVYNIDNRAYSCSYNSTASTLNVKSTTNSIVLPYGPDSIQSYIDIPYELGQVIQCPYTKGAFGKLLTDGTFVPIAYSRSSYIGTSDTPASEATNDVGFTALKGLTSGATSSVNVQLNANIQRLQLYKDTDTNKITFENLFSTNGSTTYKEDYTTTNSAYISRLEEVNVYRVLLGASDTISVGSFALYNASGDYTTTDTSKNLFDISGQTVKNYLELSYDSDTLGINSNNELYAKLSGYATSSALTAGLATKQDVLTFDSAPTSASTNPVTSGGVYTALAAKQDVLTWTYDSATENLEVN